MIRKHSDLVGSIVHDVAHLIRLRIDRKLKRFGLTRVKWLALGILHKHPMMSQTELARALELGEAATGRLVDRLEDRGLVERFSDPNDRRVRKLNLTATAERLLIDMKDLSDELRGEMLDGIPKEDLRAMERGLKALKSNLRKANIILVGCALWPLRQPEQELLESLSTMALSA
jgi:MarR family transcriptional regulator for hemolysin